MNSTIALLAELQWQASRLHPSSDRTLYCRPVIRSALNLSADMLERKKKKDEKTQLVMETKTKKKVAYKQPWCMFIREREEVI